MQRDGALQHKYWDFIENGSFDWTEASPEENVYFREAIVAFLRATFEPPNGYVIDVLEAKYVGLFPVIALGWNHEIEPLSLPERRELIRRMAEPLDRFVNAVDWEAVSQIKFGPRAERRSEHANQSLTVKWLRGHEPKGFAKYAA